MRVTLPSLPALLLLASCGSEPGAAAQSGGAGAAAATSGGGGGGSTAGSTSTTGGGGAGPALPVGGAPPSYATYGGSDSGSLFGASAVPFDPASAGGSGGGGSGGSGGSAGSGPPGDGNTAICTFRRGLSGTVTFTQEGTDVTAVIDVTGGCPGGDIELRIHDGYSCDNADTEGMPWGERGEIGTVTCDGGSATLTITRTGSDSTTSWTVADHALETDVTGHVLIANPVADTANRIACGNFF